MILTPDTPFVHQAIKDIFLDNVKMKNVVYIDTAVGEMHTMRMDTKGRIMMDPETDEPELDKHIGEICVTFEEDWSAEGNVFRFKGNPVQ